MKKQWITLLFLISILFSVSAVLAQNMPTPITTASVTAYVLNVRSGPGTGYAILTRIRRGETYTVVGRNAAGTWLKINLPKQNGWVSARYMTAIDPNSVLVDEVPGCAYSTFITSKCPTSQVTTDIVMQTFENGLMLWRKDTKEIYVLLNNGTFWNFYDTWAGEALPQETPPTGLFQPQMGFGKIWLDYPYVLNGLGWATGSESAYSSLIDSISGVSASTSQIFLRLSSGQAVGLNHYADTWFYYVTPL